MSLSLRVLSLLTLLLGALCLSACSPAGHEAAPEPGTHGLPAPANVTHPPADATVLPSGLAYKVLRAGRGKVHPTLADTVVVNYTGWTTDGKMFDSSLVRGKPAEFPLNKLIQGWQQGIPLMVVGEKARFWIPGKLAYDNRADRPNAPKGMLVFDVKLLGIKPAK
jgi:peptidylprolyl isomerase